MSRTKHCDICSKLETTTKHHSKPKHGSRRKSGPIWYLCFACHQRIHKEFSNSALRKLSLDAIQIKFKLPIKTRLVRSELQTFSEIEQMLNKISKEMRAWSKTLDKHIEELPK